MSDLDLSPVVPPTRQRGLMQFGMAVLYGGAMLILLTVVPHRTLAEQEPTQDTTMVISKPVND